MFGSPQKEYGLYRKSYLESEPGKICQAIPWQELVKSLKLKEKRNGRTSPFSLQGKRVLMILKAYTGLSGPKRFEHLNGSIRYQFFCGIFLGTGETCGF